MDVDICSQDPELDNLFSEISGRKDESIFLFFRRSFEETCKRIAEPKKATYDSYDLKFYPNIVLKYPIRFSFELSEFTIVSKGLKLHCALWKCNRGIEEINCQHNEKSSPPIKSTKAPVSVPCIIYTHTNTRSLADALELQPLAMTTGCHILAFDMPGAGKSEGGLSGSCAAVISNIDDVINWATLNLNNPDIIMWARGMSTAAAVEYTSLSISGGAAKERVKFLVLDSPYCSVKQVIDTVVQKYQEKNSLFIMAPLFRACSTMFGREVTKELGSDIYAVKPIDYASSNNTPCLILSAKNDEYIAASHGDQFLEKWSGPCFLKAIDGGHYSTRSSDNVMLAVDYLQLFLTYLEFDNFPVN